MRQLALQQQRERELKERENAELRRQLQSAQTFPPAQPQKITAAVRRVSKPKANIMLLYTLGAIVVNSVFWTIVLLVVKCIP